MAQAKIVKFLLAFCDAVQKQKKKKIRVLNFLPRLIAPMQILSRIGIAFVRVRMLRAPTTPHRSASSFRGWQESRSVSLS